MMLTIHGLPLPMKYHDIKVLVKQHCRFLSDFALDNLQVERGGTKRVSIELSDQRDGAYVIKALDGINVSGNKLQIVPADKNMSMNQAPSNLYSNSGWPSLKLQPPAAGWPQGMYKGVPQGNGPQQHPVQGHVPPQDQRYSMQQKDDPNQRQKPDRALEFRNVELIDALINRGNQRYPNMSYEAQQKPMTIKHDNFQGPTQYVMNRPNQGSVPYQGQAPIPQQHGTMGPSHGPQGLGLGLQGHGLGLQGHGPQSHMMNQPAHWIQQAQSDRYPKQGLDYDSKYPEPNQSKVKVLLERSTDYNKPYDKVPGPRLSPRRDKEGPRFSPRRDIGAPRFSPRRDKEGMKYPGMEKDRYPNQPRFSPRREVDGRFLGDSREAVGVRRYSPPRDVRKDGRDGKELPGPRFSPRRDVKETHGPRFSPRRDLKGVPGPRFSPRRDMKEVPGPRFSPRRNLNEVPGPRFSPRRNLNEVPGPRFSPRRDLKGVPGPRFSPRRDGKEVTGSRFSPRKDVKVAPGPRFSPKRDLKAAGSRFSPRRDLKHAGPRFSPRRELNEGLGPRFSPRRDVKGVSGSRYSPQRDMKAGPRFSPRKEFVDRVRMPSPGRRTSPGRGGMTRGRSPDKRFGSPTRRDSPTRQRPARFSPSRLFDKDKYTDRKDIRPAYEPTAQAPNQAMYSGGFRPSVHDPEYPIPGFRPKFEPRIEEVKPLKSRSPNRRDRSPGRDRFRKHSPSPKSPRRSWALEKRHSPDLRDAPPPPVWPGQSRDAEQFRSRRFPEKVDHRTKQPVWERPGYEEKPPGERMDVEDRRIIDKGRVDAPRFQQREPTSHSHGYKPEDHFARNPQMPREREAKFEPKYDDIRRDKPDLRPKENSGDIRHQYFSRPEEIVITKPEEFNKEFQDIYQRAIDLNKRAKELRKSDERRRFSEEHQHQEKDYDRKFRDDDRRRDHDIVEGNQGYRRDMRPESPRQGQHRVPRRDSPRRDLPRGELPREERRDITSHDRRDDRMEPRHEDRHQSPPRQRQDPQWTPSIEESRFKRERAVEEISNKLMDRHGNTLSPDLKTRVYQELKIAVMRILKDLFGHKEVSFIECVVKFQAHFSLKDEMKLFEEVMSSLPGNLRKRSADEVAKAVPAKTARIMENPGVTEDLQRQMPQEQRQRRLVPRRPTSKYVSISSKPVLYNKPHEPPTYRQRRLLPGLRKPTVQELERRLPPIRTGRVQKPVVKKVVKKTEEKKVEKPKSGDVKMNVATAKKEAPPPLEPINKEPENKEDGTLYELNSLMSDAVEAELQDIMTKVQEVLSEPVSNKADEFVVNKFRNETGEYLKNVLGVNVTKRLLDVYNDLFLKLEFLSKPTNYHIKAFMKAYNPLMVKRLKGATQFMVHARRIKDFDSLCKAKEIQCGNMKAIITPVYKFTAGPVGLKSVYKQNLENARNSTGQETSNETLTKEANVTVNIETDEKIKTENKVKIKQEKQNTVEVEDKKLTKTTVKTEEKKAPTTHIESPTTSEVVEKQDPTKTTNEGTSALEKQDPAKKSVAPAKVTQKPDLAQEIQHISAENKQSTPALEKQTTPAKAVEKKVDPPPAEKADQTPTAQAEQLTPADAVQKQASSTKTVDEQIPVQKVESIPAKKLDQAVAKAVQKQEPVKTIEEQPARNVENMSNKETLKTNNKAVKEATKLKQVTKKPITPKSTINPATKDQDKVTTRVSKLDKTKPPKPKFKSNTRKSKEIVPVFEEDLEGNEELTDQDILALMKEAIVLDECLGSEDE